MRAGSVKEIVRLGRTSVYDGAVCAFWTASGIELTLKAADLSVEVESVYGDLAIWLDVVIDGELSQRICLPRGITVIPVFTGMDGTRVRTVRILRDTQAMAQDRVSVLKIRSVEADRDAVFLPSPEPALRLEVIGDSITSGEGAGLEKQEEWVPAVFSAVNSYGYLTAELLKSRVNILSSSGWGLYASWDARTECALPPYYNGVCALAGGEENARAGAQEPWDFATYRPDVIVINLGTNDSGALNNSTRWTRKEYQPLFIDTAIRFLQNLREKNPDSYLLWAYGMLGNDMEPWILKAIEDYHAQSGDARVSYFALPPSDAAHLGVRSHPNRLAHEEAARVLAGEIRRLV